MTALRSNILPAQGHNKIPSVIWLVRIRITNRTGRLVEDRLMAVASAITPVERSGRAANGSRRREVRAIAERMLHEVGPSVIEVASKLAAGRTVEIAAVSGVGVMRAMRREQHLSVTASAGVARLVQPGLFDGRALKRQRVAEERHRRIVEECTERSALIEADTTLILAHPPEIALMLITC